MYHINKEITGSGENIALKNTAKHYFKNFNILGNSVQERTPSIEYEAPIESVGDNINLFDKDNANILDAFPNGETLIISKHTSAKILFISCEGNTTYTISKKTSSRFQLWDSVNVPTVGAKLNKALTLDYAFTGAYKTITTSENAKYLVFYYYNKSSDTISEEEIINSIKICKGTSTPYSPYGQGSIEIVNCNENLFTGELENGGYNLTTGNKATYENNVRNVKPIIVESNETYIASNNGVGIAINIFQYTRDMTFIKSSTISANKTFTTESTTKYINFSKGSTNADKIQIEKGTTITNYIQGQSQTKALYTQQPFRAIGDVKDRFIKKASVWYEEHKIFRKIFDGTENWLLVAPIYRYYI